MLSNIVHYILRLDISVHYSLTMSAFKSLTRRVKLGTVQGYLKKFVDIFPDLHITKVFKCDLMARVVDMLKDKANRPCWFIL